MGKHGPGWANRRQRGTAPDRAQRRAGTAGTAERAGARRRPGTVLPAVRRRWLGQPRRWRNAELAGVITAVALTGVLATVLDGSGDPAGTSPLVQPQPPLHTVAPPTSTTAVPPSGQVPSPTAPVSGTPGTPTRAGSPSGARPSGSAVDLCGAPANPYGYNLCGRGALVRDWAADVCSYFTCASDFGSSGGYLVMCGDDVLSTSEATGRGCAHHRGTARPVSAP